MECFGTSFEVYAIPILQTVLIYSYYQAFVHCISYRKFVNKLTTTWFKLRMFIRVLFLSLIIALSSADFGLYLPVLVGFRMVHLYVNRFLKRKEQVDDRLQQVEKRNSSGMLTLFHQANSYKIQNVFRPNWSLIFQQE